MNLRRRKKSISYARYGYYFVIPFVVAFLIFSLYPTVYTALLGFTNSKGLGNINWQLLSNPFQNFETILKNKTFNTSVANTIKIWTLNFVPQMILALLLTAWFTSPSIKLRGQGAFKVMFYMPNIITAASIAILFRALFGYPTGPVNYLLEKLGMIDAAIPFITLKAPSQYIVSFIQFWMWYGYTMIILISGVLGINPQIFEAAEIDGASNTQTFFRITLPNLRTILLYVLVTSMIGGLNMFDIPKVMLDGGPDSATLTVSVFIYNQAFSGSFLYARASAASMLLFVVIAFLSIGLFFLMRDKDELQNRRNLKALQKSRRKMPKASGGALS
ncbi:MAG TPA: sugar ABC transporter permease [Candidatus Limiplasma sp.]|nr:sugar ABC transporter permease [Candidatus Limiplasma sp.]HRX08836.1 sugar ABC transporter permease [Candidatus Limiplasma sp.]